MKKISFFFIIVFGGFLLTQAVPINRRDIEKIGFIKSYRYEKSKKEPKSEFREYEVLVKSIYKVYVDFTSLGTQHFTLDFLDYLNILLSKTHIFHAILMISDRIVRNIAFVSGFYEIDIQTGLAIDHHLFLIK